MADNEARSFEPATTTSPEQPRKDKRPEAGKVQSANPEEAKEPGRKRLLAEEVNDAEGG